MNSSIHLGQVTDESLAVVQWETIKSVTLIIVLIIVLILGVLSRAALINFIWKMAPNRPISLNILVDQMIELPNFVVMTVLLLISLVTATPIQKIFGAIGSYVFWMSTMLHNDSLAIGGCGVAIYRLICIQDLGFTLNIRAAEQLMNKIMKLEVGMMVIMIIIGLLGGLWSNEAMLLNLAKGYSADMENIINPKEDEQLQKLGKHMITLTFIIALALMLIEVSCYIFIYFKVYQNDKKIKDSQGLSKKTISSRQRRNVISLSTQVIGIGIEIFAGIIGALIVSWKITDASVFPIIASVASAIISCLHFIGSAEMRSYLYF